MTWLEQNFVINDHLSPDEIMLVAKAYILRLIEGMLMLDKFGNLIHVAYLLSIADLQECRDYTDQLVLLVSLTLIS